MSSLREFFDPVWYRERYPETAESELDPLSHYLAEGDAAGLWPHRLFDPEFYSERHPTLERTAGERLRHYLASGERQGDRPHPLFDPAFYASSNPVLEGGISLLEHFATRGGLEGRSPSAVFDASWYLERHPEVTATGLDALSHYIELGDAADCWPHPLFDPGYYGQKHPEIRRHRAARLIHYLDYGESRGEGPHPLFDPTYYLAQNPDLQHVPSLLAHFVRFGAVEGRSPCPLFDAVWYRQQNPGIGTGLRAPLLHYLARGDADDLWPHPLFDPVLYGDLHPDVPHERGARLRHFIENGGRDGTSPHPLFDAAGYLARHPELMEQRGNVLLHYLERGEAQGECPHPLFDPVFYLADNPDLDERTALLDHYCRTGWREWRDPNPLFDSRWYAEEQELLEERVNPLIHYVLEGAGAGADPHPLFDADAYRAAHPEEVASSAASLGHYLTRGAAAGADPHPLFDAKWYAERHRLGDGELAVHHYTKAGASAGAEPNPLFRAETLDERYAAARRSGETPLGWFLRRSKPGTRPGPHVDFCLQFFRQASPALLDPALNPLAGWFRAPGLAWTSPEVELPARFEESTDPRASILIPAFGPVGYTLACLRSIARARTQVDYEVIVVDDGSIDNGLDVLAGIPGLRLLRNDTGLGYLRSCNRGAAEARGEFLVLLNNDTLVTDRWLDELVSTLDEFPRAGAVGSKLVYPNGVLQEAGSIVFCDGTAWNYGGGEPADGPAYDFAREVDYTSAASMLVRRELFEAVGGFDEAYEPAFYEDTDLAFKIRAAGSRVIYQPASTVLHFGGASHGHDPSRGLKHHQELNRATFMERWESTLASHPAPNGDLDEAALRYTRGHVLVVDATGLTPDRDAGSLRMFNLMRVLRRLGFSVTFAASDLARDETGQKALARVGIEVAAVPPGETLIQHLEACGSRYDLCILSRPDVADRWIDSARLLCPRAPILYDTVDLHFIRRQRELDLLGFSALGSEIADAELRAARAADGVIVVSDVDGRMLRNVVPNARIHVVSTIQDVDPIANPFAERSGILFIGGFGHPPNIDAVEWFVRDVLPRVHEQLPGIGFHVVGGGAPKSTLAFAGDLVTFEGFVKDVRPHFARSRISVAPIRVGSGVKGKINQSMAHGLPCVATSVAVEGMNLVPDVDVLIADGAAAFAEKVVELYSNEPLWASLAANGLTSVEKYFSTAAAEESLRALLSEHGLI